MQAHEHEHFRRVRSPFVGDLVRLRALEEDDLPAISTMFNDPDVLRFMDSVTFPEPLAGTRSWWERTRTNSSARIFGIETIGGEVVGCCGLESISARDRSALLGIWVGKPFWGKGYGTDAVRILCRFAFREMNLQRVTLHVLETNPRGRRSYEKVGFKEEGRLRRERFVEGRYVDVIVMGLLAEEVIEL